MRPDSRWIITAMNNEVTRSTPVERHRSRAAGDPALVDIWILEATEDLGRKEIDELLVSAVAAASALRDPHAVTTVDVNAQLPEPYPDHWPVAGSTWDLRSIGQRLSTLADQGRILRCGVRADFPGGPAVQHWWAPGAIIPASNDGP
jgi:hypothetical protein